MASDYSIKKCGNCAWYDYTDGCCNRKSKFSGANVSKDFLCECWEELHQSAKCVDKHDEICKRLNEIYEKKNKDYDDSFHQTFLEEGMAMPRIRLGDKYRRFCTLTRSDEQSVKDESIVDTLLDLANYAIMTVMELENDKG